MSPLIKKRTLLIVDDNATNLKVAVEHLKAYSYTILTASNGESGLERAQLTQPDLILLDIKMPGIDGIETCRRLKANPDLSAIPVIFMTALGDADDKVRGLEAGAVDYITKPIEAAELLARVQTHLTLRDLQLSLEERVQERTATLEDEVARRKRNQAERDQLLDLVRQQSEQLHYLTQQVLDSQAQRDQGLAEALKDQVAEKMGLLEIHLSRVQHSLKTLGTLDPALRSAQAATEQALGLLAEIRQQTQQVTDNLHQRPPTDQQVRESPLFKLTTREYEVLQLIAQGKTNAEIADLLVVARPTISTYRTRILNKLGLQDLPSLIKFAIEHRLIS